MTWSINSAPKIHRALFPDLFHCSHVHSAFLQFIKSTLCFLAVVIMVKKSFTVLYNHAGSHREWPFKAIRSVWLQKATVTVCPVTRQLMSVSMLFTLHLGVLIVICLQPDVQVTCFKCHCYFFRQTSVTSCTPVPSTLVQIPH